MPFIARPQGGNTRWLVGASTEPRLDLPESGAGTKLLEEDTGNTWVWSGTKWFPTSTAGGEHVTLSDPYDRIVNAYFSADAGGMSTLAAALIPGQYEIDPVAAGPFTPGNSVSLGNAFITSTDAVVLSKNAGKLIMDRPSDIAFPPGTLLKEVSTEMAVNGASTPKSFSIVPMASRLWHVKSTLLSMTFNSDGADNQFGDLNALTRGILLRYYDGETGEYRTITNWKTVSDIKLDFRDASYDNKKGGGKFGFSADGQWGVRTGALPTLNGANGDRLEVLVQDDLSGLFNLKIKAQGYVTRL